MIKRPLISVIIFSILIFGCAKLDQDYPQRNYYIIDIERTRDKSDKMFNKTLEISKFNISPKFSGREFIYKTAESKYTSDFYNQFFKTPVSIINAETYEWLTESGLFKDVIDRTIPVEPDYLLNANITEIYIDLTLSGGARSVLSIQFFISEESSLDSKIIFSRNYEEEVTVKSISPDNFMKGWNQALEKILNNLEKDLEGLSL